MDTFHTRLEWRNSMDRGLKRLMKDLDFARDERLKEYADKARCDHLDKVHEWYLKHGMKEARKERAAPPYVRFGATDPVMAGSMRVPPRSFASPEPMLARLRDARGSGSGGMTSSTSLPLLATGTLLHDDTLLLGMGLGHL